MGKMGELSALVSELQRCGEALITIAGSLQEMFSANEPQEEKPSLPERVLTLEDVRPVLAQKSVEGHTAEVQALIKKYGADKLSRVAPEHYAALLREAEVL